MKIFVSGTDTSVGKTFVSAALCRKLGWNYWKPIQSGDLDSTDSDFCRRFLGHEQIESESYVLSQPLSPHAAAKIDRCEISINVLLNRARTMTDTIIEGAGGLLVPLNDFDLQLDFIKKLSVPMVLVARSSLGTINHSLLSIEAIRKRKIELLGVIVVGHIHSQNSSAIAKYGKTKILGEIPIFENVNFLALDLAAAKIQLPAKMKKISANKPIDLTPESKQRNFSV